ncbi:MAG TPA: cytochrome c biogenesis protein CcdA [Polyangiaceae bacterium]|nr:cytochrome c biogenesis protein CcdA [Polyangiaceae bacterium]
MRSRSVVLATSILALSLALWPLAAFAGDGGSDTGAFQRALSHGAVFALGASYVFGLATSLTPCVYPMIAITVSVFGAKEAKTRLQGMLLSLTFVLGIVCLFTPLGVVSALTGKGFGAALGNPWVVALIATVFVVLAASLFGAFEIALPPALQNRLSSVGGTGYRGALLLGLVCGLIAAPCVGPFLFGLLGWIATTRNVAVGSAAMALYGLGLGTLFFVVGTFAVNLPKAGAWMMGTKWVGGVCLAYMALGYIRDALPKESLHKLAQPGTLYGAAGLVILAIGLGLAGVHIAAERRRSSIARLSKPTKLASIVPAIVGLFMVVTWWQLPKSTVIAIAGAATEGSPATELRWESSESAATARAAAEHKPMLVDFGATWCGACKELEERTFPDPRVRAEGARYVALHVDATNDDDPTVARVRDKYGATAGLPVVLLFGSDGKEAVRFTEFVPPERFAAALARVR